MTPGTILPTISQTIQAELHDKNLTTVQVGNGYQVRANEFALVDLTCKVDGTHGRIISRHFNIEVARNRLYTISRKAAKTGTYSPMTIVQRIAPIKETNSSNAVLNHWTEL